MDWCKEDVPSAVAKAAASNSMLIVYIYGDDEASKIMDSCLEESEVLEKTKQFPNVALKLDSISDSCQQFSQVYPVICIPSIYFIRASDRALLEGAVNVTDKNTLLNHMDKALQNFGPFNKDKANSPNSPADKENLACGEAQVAKQVESTTATTSPTCSSSQSPVPLDQKIDRAKEIIETKQKQRAAAEIQKEKNDETSRRNVGKSLTELKRWQKEQQQKEDISEWQKQKKADKEAKERIRQQIEQDRQERRLRHDAEKKERDARLAKKLEERAAKAEAASALSSAARSSMSQQLSDLRQQRDNQYTAEQLEAEQRKNENQALKDKANEEERAGLHAERMQWTRLQFRFPDGSTLTNDFSSSDSLQTVMDFLSQEAQKRMRGGFRLATIFPRRNFVADDLQLTLLALDLVPATSLAVLPGPSIFSSGSNASVTGAASPSNLSVASVSRSLFGFIQWLLAPLTSLWSYLWGFVTADHRNTPDGQPSYARGQERMNRGQPNAQIGTNVNTDSGEGQGAKRRPGTGGMFRFHDLQRDPNDDSNTYNGNSTQQL